MIRYEELPPDQRAVLSLLLRQRKRYDEVAAALGIQPAAVHDRAHAALTVLAPSQARLVEPAARERIGEYLLGQQSPEEAATTKQYLAGSTPAREWARTLAVELVKLAAHSLPEIPAPAGPMPPPTTPAPAVAAPASQGGATAADASAKPDGSSPQISRRGGALLLAGIVVIAVVVVAIVLSSGGSGGSNRSGNQAASRSSTKNESSKEEAGSHETNSSSPSTGSGASSTGSGKGKVKLEKLAEMKPTAVGSPAKGFAAIVSKERAHAVEIEANGLPPTQGFSYVVWLVGTNGEPSALGRIPTVNSKGQVKVIEALATSPSSVKGIEISRETSAHPKTPGTLVLKGNFVGS